MKSVEERIREELNTEAEKWVKAELVKRMGYAKEAIEYQADVSSMVCGEEGAEKHVKNAGAYAKEEIRRDLEHEARLWVEKEHTRRMKFVTQEDSLEPRNC